MREIEQIDGKIMQDRRHEMGLTLEEMGVRCTTTARFLRMLEDEEIKTTSSAMMAEIAHGYGFERGQCVSMIAYWSETWPRSAFVAGGKDRRRKWVRLRDGGKMTKKMQRTQVEYRPYVIIEAMRDRGWSNAELANEAGLTKQRIESIVRAYQGSVSVGVLAKIASALDVRIGDISPGVVGVDENAKSGKSA